VCHWFCKAWEAAGEAPVEIGETKKDLDIAIAGWFQPLRDCADSVWLHFHAFQNDNEVDKADPLQVKFATQQLQVEACLLKLREDEPDKPTAPPK
jgi:hypothetical protein